MVGNPIKFGQIIHRGLVAAGQLSINGTGSLDLHSGAAAGAHGDSWQRTVQTSQRWKRANRHTMELWWPILM